jgi:hypothetical protein
MSEQNHYQKNIRILQHNCAKSTNAITSCLEFEIKKIRYYSYSEVMNLLKSNHYFSSRIYLHHVKSRRIRRTSSANSETANKINFGETSGNQRMRRKSADSAEISEFSNTSIFLEKSKFEKFELTSSTKQLARHLLNSWHVIY